jgi:hypothetical protein
MAGQEEHHLPAHLEVRDVRVEQHPVHALDLESHVTIEDLVDVRLGHPPTVNAND